MVAGILDDDAGGVEILLSGWFFGLWDLSDEILFLGLAVFCNGTSVAAGGGACGQTDEGAKFHECLIEDSGLGGLVDEVGCDLPDEISPGAIFG